MTEASDREEIRFEFTNDSCDVTLLTVTTRVAVLKFHIADPVGKAAWLNGHLPGMLQDFREMVGQRDLTLSHDLADVALLYLDSYARRIATVLFGEDEMHRFMDRVTAALEGTFRKTKWNHETWPIINIRASEDEPLGWFIPFEIFPLAGAYKAGAHETLQFECFLGQRAPVVRTRHAGRDQLARSLNGKIETLFLSTRDRLPGVADQRKYFAENSNDFETVGWPDRHKVFKHPPLQQLADLWRQERAIIHVACHYHPSGPNTSAKFDFGAECSVGTEALMGALTHYEKDSSDLPLVFLNACNTAAVTDPYGALMPSLADLGYMELIGSRCLLPDRVAGHFARALYGHLLSERRPGLADAIVLARRALAEKNNPAGLLYVHYGSPLLRLGEPQTDQSQTDQPQTDQPQTDQPQPSQPVASRTGLFDRVKGWLGAA